MNIKANCQICNSYVLTDHEILGMIIENQDIMLELKDSKCKQSFHIQIPLKSILTPIKDTKTSEK